AALARRNETGTGDFIDLAMLDVSTAILANQAMNYLVSGTVPVRRGNKHPNIQPQDVFAVKDGHIVLAVGNDEQFVRFAATIGRPDLATDERFRLNEARVRNLPELMTIIGERLMQDTADAWLNAFRAANVPCGPINTIDRVFTEPQVEHRQMLRHLPHPLAGTVPQVVSPLRFRNSPLSFEAAPPLLGAHTQQVLAELGIKAKAGGA
ncbi:MAG: CoA transferase, partial [Pseudolabrys sp.]|nr:CoA transferase [Pseudolabrys sp.]